MLGNIGKIGALMGALSNPDTERKIKALLETSDKMIQNEAEIFRDLEMMDEDQDRHIMFADWVLAAVEVRKIFITLFNEDK